MVRRVAAGVVDDGRRDPADPVVDEKRPERRKADEPDIDPSVERHQEGKDMVRRRLGEAVDGMEGEADRRIGLAVAMMIAMEPAIERLDVQRAMDPIDAGLGEEDDHREAEREIGPAIGGNVTVNAAVSFCDQDLDRQQQKRIADDTVDRPADRMTQLGAVGAVVGHKAVAVPAEIIGIGNRRDRGIEPEPEHQREDQQSRPAPLRKDRLVEHRVTGDQ